MSLLRNLSKGRHCASPISSKSSFTSSTRSSGRRGYSRTKTSGQTRTAPSIYSQNNSDTTLFSERASTRSGTSARDTASVRSTSSTTSSQRGTSRLRQELLRSPDESNQMTMMELFPFAKARSEKVPFQIPKYEGLSVDDLRIQMLRTVFGWDNDIEMLIRDEHDRHQPGTASAVLLSKWLGDSEADMAAAMVGSESMTSMDWMFLALSSMGNSQKKVAETFVQRLLEKGDIHPAVAILIGLDEPHDAIEVYVSRHYYMEAILLTCLAYPRDWQRISHLVRKWGEAAFVEGKHELSSRCFSCTSMEAAEAYLSPRAQDAQYAAAQQHIIGALSPPLSPPGSDLSRMRPSNAGLKLVTDFDARAKSPAAVGVTPIAESAVSMAGVTNFRSGRGLGSDSARTATPGGFNRVRIPSRSGTERSGLSDATPLANDRSALPLTALQQSRRDQFDRPTSRNSRASSLSVTNSLASSASRTSNSRASQSNTSNTGGGRGEPDQTLATLTPLKFKPDAKNGEAALPSPAYGVFDALSKTNHSRNGSRTRKPSGLHLDMQEQIIELAPETGNTGYQTVTTEASSRVTADIEDPLPTASSMASAKVRSIDKYISSLQEANYYAQQQRSADRQRTSSRDARGSSRSRTREQVEPREPRGRAGVKYVRGPKRSPSSPVSMSPDDPALQLNLPNLNATQESTDDESFYRVTSPIDSQPRGRSSNPAGRGPSKQRSGSKVSKRAESPGSTRLGRQRSSSRANNAMRRASPDRSLIGEARGRSHQRSASHQRSPSSPLPMSAQAGFFKNDGERGAGSGDSSEELPSRFRQRSTNRRPGGGRSTNKQRDGSPERILRTERSRSRNPARDPLPDVREEGSHEPRRRQSTRTASRSRMPRLQTNLSVDGSRSLTKKQLAAKELEDRRLSLARRPSAPAVIHPDDIERTQRLSFQSRPSAGLPPTAIDALSPVILAEMGFSALPTQAPRSAISERGERYDLPTASRPQFTGTSTSSVPIGLPATPRAMRHPKYMTADPSEPEIPALPNLPSEYQNTMSKEAEDIPFTLPSTTYSAPTAPRCSTAPPGRERVVGHHRSSQGGSSSNHFRKNSRTQAEILATVNDDVDDSQVVIIEEASPSSPAGPTLLPELQHLAGPPPPPPPPSMFQNQSANGPGGVISVVIDESSKSERTAGPGVGSLSRTNTPAASGQSPQSHRRGRGSVSGAGGVGEKFRSVRDRMRSTSRSGRVKSPPLDSFTPSPYESIQPSVVFPHVRRESQSRNSPPAATAGVDYQSMIPPPPPVPALPAEHAGASLEGLVLPDPAGSKSNTPFLGYRNPKEIRANMPPEQLQMGVYQGANVI